MNRTPWTHCRWLVAWLFAGTLVVSAADAPQSQPAGAPPAVGAAAAGGPAPAAADVKAKARELARKGAAFLLAAQEQEGGWSTKAGAGITALALKALAQQPDFSAQQPAIQRGLAKLLEYQRDDGGIYAAEGLYKNYESAVTLALLALLHRAEDQARIAALQKFLKDLQWDESEDHGPDDPWYGGAGYGRGKRPDLSNTQLMLDALHDSGLKADDPAFKKALVFVQRCQMLGETNDQAFAKGSNTGGFIYSPANGGESKADYEEIGGRKELRCFGSMTYSGLKSMLYAGLSRDDPRVRAALQWISRNWTLDGNPNMPEGHTHEGHFYYLHVFARTLRTWGEDTVTDAKGAKHDWRRELVEKLAQLQGADGRWVNDADRYMEGDPNLTTAYALLALAEAFPVDAAAAPAPAPTPAPATPSKP